MGNKVSAQRACMTSTEMGIGGQGRYRADDWLTGLGEWGIHPLPQSGPELELGTLSSGVPSFSLSCLALVQRAQSCHTNTLNVLTRKHIRLASIFHSRCFRSGRRYSTVDSNITIYKRSTGVSLQVLGS